MMIRLRKKRAQNLERTLPFNHSRHVKPLTLEKDQNKENRELWHQVHQIWVSTDSENPLGRWKEAEEYWGDILSELKISYEA